ncbi:MAG: hypothetical protein UX00_C0007G0001, partial [Microgenomates group bacterium GW2011_GWB1_45_17]
MHCYAHHISVFKTKTKRLGQFFSTSPLKSGEYRITTEKDGFTFDPITLS